MIVITVESQAKSYSRYDKMIMCGGFNALGEQLFVSGERCEHDGSHFSLEVEDAHHIEMIIYIIPKSLPGTKNSPIEDNPPFGAQVTINSSDKELYCREHQVNAWGGSVVKLDLEI